MTKDAYALEADKFNRVKFDEVETKAVRLSIQQSDEGTAGVHEFRVGP